MLPGEPLLMVTDALAAEVVAYVPSLEPNGALFSTWRGGEVAVGSRVKIARRNDPRRTAEGVVSRVGPAVAALPPRLWRNPNTAEYGLPVLIAGAQGIGILPGEALEVRLLP